MNDTEIKILNDNNLINRNISFDSDGDMSSVTDGHDKMLLNKQCLRHDRKESNEYYLRNSKEYGNNNGPTFLVALALCDTSLAYKYIKPADVDTHLLISKFVSNLTRGQRTLFGLILDMVKEENNINEETDNNNNIDDYILTRIPLDDSDLRQYYLDGSNSIMKNLPRPKVILHEKHSYVSIKMCIADYLGKGYLPLEIATYEKEVNKLVTDSKFCKGISRRAKYCYRDVSRDNLIIMTGVTWSDDFEPNSMSKNNRGSVWIKTLTFFTKNSFSNSLENTYPISIALKKENHDDIERLFIKELNELKSNKGNMFYCKALDKNVHVYFELIACLGDQPERRGINYMLGGNGKFSSRFGHCANIHSIKKKLPSCTICMKKMRTDPLFLKKMNECVSCVNWNMLEKSNLMKCKTPKGYLSTAYLSPKKITFADLKDTINVCHDKLIKKEWNENNVRVFAAVNCISKEGQDKIIEHAENYLALQSSMLIHEEDNILEKDATMFPSKYKKWIGGPYYTGTLEIYQFLDCIMHLLFLGVVKTTKGVITDWINRNKKKNIYNVMKKYMYKHIPYFKFDWCKVIEAESGWVSDNYLAYCRLAKWIYHPITTSKEVHVENPSQVDKWNMNDCKKWLKRYGLIFEGKLDDLRSTILMHKKSPLPLLEVNQSCSSHNICTMIGCMLSMISQVMKREVNEDTPLQMDREIKLFLSYLNIVSTSLQESTTVWINSYNCQSLLNLPFAVELFGPLANYWEGGNCGEGYLRHVKPRIRDVHTKNWNMNVHINLLNDTSMGSVLDTHFSKKSSKRHLAKYQRFKKQSGRLKNMYHQYSSVEELYVSFKQQVPISFVMTTDGKYYSIVKKRNIKIIGGISVRFRFDKKVESLSMSFHHVDFDFSKTDDDIKVIDELLIEKYLLMLPEIRMKDSMIQTDDSRSYYCIDSNWQEFDENIKLIYPQSPFCNYSFL